MNARCFTKVVLERRGTLVEVWLSRKRQSYFGPTTVAQRFGCDEPGRRMHE